MDRSPIIQRSGTKNLKERIDSLEEQIRVKQTKMTEELKKEISSFVRHEVKRILAEQQKGKDNFDGTTQNIEEYDSLLLEKEKREKNNMKQELISELKEDVRRILKEEQSEMKQNEMKDTQQLYEEDMGQRMYERNEVCKLVVKDIKSELMPQLRAEVIQNVLQELKESTDSSVDSINLLADADAM